MKWNYLFPNRYKKIGLSILIPSLIVGLIVVIYDIEPEVFDLNVPAIFVNDILGEKEIIGITNNNILNEICGIFLIISLILVAFSKEKQEDELINKIRLDSLVWATYLNYGILLLAMIFVYEISFLWVMIFNMFTILLFFIIRFNWQVMKLNKGLSYEE
jgi:hypothetical protein